MRLGLSCHKLYRNNNRKFIFIHSDPFILKMCLLIINGGGAKQHCKYKNGGGKVSEKGEQFDVKRDDYSKMRFLRLFTESKVILNLSLNKWI